MRSQLQSRRGPCVEMVANRDGARRPMRLTDRPVLIEGGGPEDRWLVHALSLINVVHGTVRGQRAMRGSA